MKKSLKKTLFGFKPVEVFNEMQHMDEEHERQAAKLQADIENAKAELSDVEKKRAELQERLNVYLEREHMIADVMVTAQINARKIEEEAREKARAMLEKSDQELRQKNQELDFLRIKVARFKEEFKTTLDNYKYSLETIKDSPDDIAFAPTLIVSEKIPDTVKKKDTISS